MDLEATVLLKGESAYRFELDMKGSGGRVRLLERGRGRVKGGLDPRVANDQRAALWCRDLLGAAIENVLFRNFGRTAWRPIDLDKVGCADGCRVRRRAYDDPTRHKIGGVVEHEAGKISLHPLRRGIIDSADHRTVARRRDLGPGIDHAFNDRIDAVARRAVDLRRNVQRIGLFPNEPTLRGRLDRQLREFIRYEFARRLPASDDLAVGDGLICGEHGALAGGAFRRVHIEQLGACLDKSDSPRGAGSAVKRKIDPHRRAAAGVHVAPLRIAIDHQDANVCPVDLELVSDDAGDGSADMLTHLRTDDVHGHDAIAVDAVPNGGFEGARPRLLRRALFRRETERDGGAGHADQKGAARKRALLLQLTHWS